MSIKIGDKKIMDETGTEIEVVEVNKKIVKTKTLSKDGSPSIIIDFTIDQFKALNWVPRVVNMKPGFVGIKNCTYSCFMNSVFQSIFTCPPLLGKLLAVRDNPEGILSRSGECRQKIIHAFYHVFDLLQSERGTINIKFFYDAVRDSFSSNDDPSVFLDYIFTNLFNCGLISERSLNTKLLGFHWDLTKVSQDLKQMVEGGHIARSCLLITTRPRQLLQEAIANVEQTILLSAKQNFIVIHPEFGADPQGVPSLLSPDGIISIHGHRFRVTSVIIRVGVGHYYTVTWRGRFNDDNVEENPQFMINLLANGFDEQTDPEIRQNNGCYYFFERYHGDRHHRDGDRHRRDGDGDSHRRDGDGDRHRRDGDGDRHRRDVDRDGDGDRHRRDGDSHHRDGDGDRHRRDGDSHRRDGDGDRHRRDGDGDRHRRDGDRDRHHGDRKPKERIEQERKDAILAQQLQMEIIEQERERERERARREQEGKDAILAQQLQMESIEQEKRERARREQERLERLERERRDEQFAQSIRDQELAQQTQIADDEVFAKSFQGQGGYKQKYLKYKNKYLLLKKKINN
jgi:hypothetical protein